MPYPFSLHLSQGFRDLVVFCFHTGEHRQHLKEVAVILDFQTRLFTECLIKQRPWYA